MTVFSEFGGEDWEARSPPGSEDFEEF